MPTLRLPGLLPRIPTRPGPRQGVRPWVSAFHVQSQGKRQTGGALRTAAPRLGRSPRQPRGHSAPIRGAHSRGGGWGALLDVTRPRPPTGAYLKLGCSLSLAQAERDVRLESRERDWGSRDKARADACPCLRGGSRQCPVARQRWSSCGLSPTSRPPAPRCASRLWAKLAAGTQRRNDRSSLLKTGSPKLR